MSTQKKGVAIVGFGGMGYWHRKKIGASDVVELRGIWDIKEDRRQLAKNEGIHVYTSFEDVLADPTVDIVTIAVPNELHRPLSIAALEAGKNVISEKPVCLSSEELADIIAASERTGKLFTTHQNRRWDADFLLMKQIYESGEIGKVFNIESRVHGSRGIPSDWRGEKVHGGGMLYDWGIHLIDQIMMVFGWAEIKSVYCICDNITNEEVDDGFRLDIVFASGQRATIEVGTYNFIAMPRFYLRAEKGSALITDWREEAKVVKCKYWHENDVLPVKTAAGLTKTMAPRDDVTTETYSVEKPASDVHDYYRHFVKAIREGVEQDVTYSQMRTDLKIILSAFKSAETGLPVEF